MTLRTLLSGLAVMGFVACAGAQTENDVTYTMADVEASPEAWRAVDPENLVIMETSKGQIVIELLPVVAPAHVDQFKAYIRAGLYDGTEFHRVIKGFMAQGGDVEATHGAERMLEPMQAEFIFRRDPAVVPMNTIGPADSADGGYHLGFPMTTQPGFLAEMSKDGLVESWIPHCPGVLSTARTDDPNSGNAQFFLISDEGQHLDYKYTAKGRAIQGLDVIKAIKLGPSPDGYPIANPDVVMSVKIAADMPEAERPRAFVQRTDTPAWQETLDAADAGRKTICDLPAVPAVVE
ncbi:MAG: peptidylprolyl isomerase [Pseudomonadota bacterium]|jgi:peptidylprolyl isomerase|nr:peptidylprolyl isomerase [Pseudomonadota bacterium]